MYENDLVKGPTIINLDNHGDGTHWVGIKEKDKNVLEYQDSFGVVPPFKLKETLIMFNPYIKQDKKAVNCGKFALNFLRK